MSRRSTDDSDEPQPEIGPEEYSGPQAGFEASGQVIDSTSDESESAELDLFAQLEQAREADADEDLEDDSVSLEDLSRAYAHVTGAQSIEAQATEIADAPSGSAGAEAVEGEQEPGAILGESDSPEDTRSEEALVSPRSILEAMLYVGKEDGTGYTASQLAKSMRGVNEKEVQDWINELNALYEQTGRAIRIVERSDGYRAELAEELEFIRERFYGQTREIALNQSAIDCLALIAYQPGISRDELEHQRGQPSGGVLNQLVRRQLVVIHRSEEGKRKVAHYHPTEKLLELAGLTSLEDLPQVEDLDME